MALKLVQGKQIATASWAINAISSSFAQTASFALNAGGTTINTGSFVTTSSFNSFTSSYNTGSFTGSFTGSLFGTASFAVSSSRAVSSSFATSASWAPSTIQTLQEVTNAGAETENSIKVIDPGNSSVQLQQSGIYFEDLDDDGNTLLRFENTSVANQEIFIRGLAGTMALLSDIPDIGSLVTTSSFNAFTSSYNTGSFTGSFSGLITGSLFGTASFAVSSSFATTSSFAVSASWAPMRPGGSDTQIQYNSGSTLVGINSFTFNYQSQSLQQGFSTIASGSYSHAEGYQTTAIGERSHAEGQSTIAFGTGSHAEGQETITSGSYSHAEGYRTITSGSYSHAEGGSTIARGNYSHAEGYATVASGSHSHAEGFSTTATGGSSHAEGNGVTATGPWSHAEGRSTQASGTGSHAEGFTTIASGDYQHVQGQYNISSTAQLAFIIGNGTSSGNRSNLVFASGSQFQVTGSVIATQGFTGSLFGTASFATTASYALNGGVTQIVAGTNVTITNGGSGSVTINAAGSGGNIDTGSFATTGSNQFSGSQTITGSLNVTQGITGSLFGTASFATTASYVVNAQSASYVLQAVSSSFATTASYALNAGVSINTSSLATTGSNNFIGNQNITGSLYISSSAVTLGQFAGNQNGYVEFSIRNTSTGVSASSDIAVYADNGTVSNNYIDMGINGSGMDSTYSYFGTDFGNALDAYVYNVGGNLRMGNATSAAPFSQSFFLFSNPTATPNIWITGSQVAINKNLGTPINGTFDISGSTVITGSLTVTKGVKGIEGIVQAFSLGLQNIF
jgi:hypothetical protein